MKAKTFSRRQVLGFGIGMGRRTVRHHEAGPGGAPAPGGNFDWMQQKGKSIVVICQSAVYYNLLQKLIPVPISTELST